MEISTLFVIILIFIQIPNIMDNGQQFIYTGIIVSYKLAVKRLVHGYWLLFCRLFMNRIYIWKRSLVYTISKDDEKWFYNSQGKCFLNPNGFILSMGPAGIQWRHYFINIIFLKVRWRKLTVCYISLILWHLTVLIY